MNYGNWVDLFKAVQDNDLELVRFHVMRGVDVNYQHPQYFTTPLIESIRLGHHLITKHLLENGASIELKEIYSNKNAKEIAKELQNKEAITILLHFLNKSKV